MILYYLIAHMRSACMPYDLNLVSSLQENASLVTNFND